MSTFTGTTVCAEALADCPFSIAQEYAEAFFHEAQSGAHRHHVAMTFDSQYDAAEIGRRHDEIRVHWNPETPLLPDFLGTVRFRINGGRTRVVIGLSYHVPFGVVGRLIDGLAGAQIAHARAADLATRLALYLERRQRDWRDDFRPLPLQKIPSLSAEPSGSRRER